MLNHISHWRQSTEVFGTSELRTKGPGPQKWELSVLNEGTLEIFTEREPGVQPGPWKTNRNLKC